MLYALPVHSGWRCERGHSFSCVRAGNGQWYETDDARVTACDESAALSQSAYVLFYSREAAWEGGAGGGTAAALTADPAGPGEPAGDASGRAPGSEVSPGNTEVEGVSLEQWRRLQERNRPKPEDRVGPACRRSRIHQSQHGGGRPADRPSTDSPPPASASGRPERPRGRTRSRGRLGAVAAGRLRGPRVQTPRRSLRAPRPVGRAESRRGASPLGGVAGAASWRKAGRGVCPGRRVHLERAGLRA